MIKMKNIPANAIFPFPEHEITVSSKGKSAAK